MALVTLGWLLRALSLPLPACGEISLAIPALAFIYFASIVSQPSALAQIHFIEQIPVFALYQLMWPLVGVTTEKG